MVLRRIVSRFGASILTSPGECAAVAPGLSARIASTSGRDSSLAWKAMNTFDMVGISSEWMSAGEAGLGQPRIERLACALQRLLARNAQCEFGHRRERGLRAIGPGARPTGDQCLVLRGVRGRDLDHRIDPAR